jgi:hypothetical protein
VEGERLWAGTRVSTQARFCPFFIFFSFIILVLSFFLNFQILYFEFKFAGEFHTKIKCTNKVLSERIIIIYIYFSL